MLPAQTSRHACAALLVALLSSVPFTTAQEGCGLQGFSACGSERGGGCCPSDWECFATECSYTGISTAPPPTTTACPGVPAHHLCPDSQGGDCCYQAHACDPDNAKQCILTSTQRVFEQVETVTTVVDGTTETTITTSIFYPWPTVLPRETPKGSVAASDSASDSPETTPAPSATGSGSGSVTPAPTGTSSVETAAAGRVGAGIGGIVGGVFAGLLL